MVFITEWFFEVAIECLLSRLELLVTMHDFFIPWLWNEGKQPCIFYSDGTVYSSNKFTVSTKHSWGKRYLWGKRQPYELSLPWKSNIGIVKINFWSEGEDLAHLSQLSLKCLQCLPSRWFSLGVLYPIILWWFCWYLGWP